MALVNGTNYDHIDLHAASGGDVTRHKLQDTDGRAMVAPTEASSTASAAHPAGSYFIYNNKLYQATSDIASGGTITPNTNCVAATVGGEVSDLKSAIPITYIPVTNTGHYIKSTGAYQSDAKGRMSDPISMNAGDLLVVDYAYGSVAGIGAIAQVNENSYTVLRSNGGSTSVKHFVYRATESITVVVSGLGGSSNTGTTAKLYGVANIYIDYTHVNGLETQLSNIKGIANAVYTITSGYYINTRGERTSGSTGRMSSAITLTAWQKIIVDYSAGTSVAFAVIASVNNGVYTPLVLKGTDSTKTHFEYFAKEQINVVVSWLNSATATIKIQSVSNLFTNAKNVANLDDAINSIIPWEFILEDTICIGDSLTRGYTPSETRISQNYLYFLSKMLGGVQMTNAGVGGITTKNWYNNEYGNYTMQNYKSAIIFLGTNGGLTDTLDTDVEPYDDYNNYADTNTGCYCKIIEHLKADVPNIAIVLVNIYHLGTSDDTTRSVINQIATRYSLPVINTMSLGYSNNPAYHGNSDNVHLTKAGYLALAHLIASGLREYCTTNKNYANKGMTVVS